MYLAVKQESVESSYGNLKIRFQDCIESSRIVKLAGDMVDPVRWEE